jgi:protein O-mannosyl-transferase
MQFKGNSKYNPFRSPLVLTAVMVIFVFISYWPLHENSFIKADDDNYITQNSHVMSGLSIENVKWAFTSFAAGYWIPLAWLSHMVDAGLFGLNPGVHHLVNLFLHIINAILLLLFFKSISRSFGLSLVVATLWAVHPLRVESVAWAAERKDLLCGFFFLCSLLLYNWYVQKPDIKKYIALFLVFVLGLMSKPMIVTFPFLILLLDVWPYARIRKRDVPGTALPQGIPQFRIRWLIVEKIPFLLPVILCCIITFFMAQKSNAVAALNNLTVSTRIGNAVISYAAYIKDLFWPLNLIPFYS